MGLGGTAKKLQRMIDMAEQTYNRLNEMREQLNALRTTVEETGERVEKLESEQDEQRALLEALAEEQGLDVDTVLADARSVDADEPGATDDSDAAEDATPDADKNS